MKNEQRTGKPIYVYRPAPGRTWFQRTRDIQNATGFTIKQLARISGLERQTIKRLITTRHHRIRGSYAVTYRPTLTTIRRIRKLESMYSHQLYAYQQCRLFLNRNKTKYTTQTVWIEGTGWQTRRVEVKRNSKPLFEPLAPPGRAADTRAMVGGTSGTHISRPRRDTNPKALEALVRGRERIQRRIQARYADRFAQDFASGVCVEIVESQSDLETNTPTQSGLGIDGCRGSDGYCADVATEQTELTWEL